MKGLLFIFSLAFSLFLCAQGYVNPNYHWVEGYYRSNGTYVQGYYRTNPNQTNRDNYSTRGNTNPHTGQRGWVAPDNYPITYPSTYSYPSNSNNSSKYSGSYNSSSYSSSYSSGYETSRISNNRGTIQYLDGRDDFGVTRERLTTNSNGITLYYYDPVADEVSSSEAIPSGLLLHGKRTIIDDKGNMIISTNYDKGRLHGEQIVYGEGQKIVSKSIMRYGEAISYETYDEEGEKWRFEQKSVYTQMTYYRGEDIRKTIITYPSGKEIIEEFDDGDEELDYKYVLVDDLLHGPFSVFYANGNKKRTGNFELGMLEGQVKNYTDDGNLRSIETYKDNVIDGPFLEYEDGEVTTKGQFKNGLRDGRWNYFFHDTKGSYIYQFVTYTDDRLNGPFQRASFDTIRVGNYLFGEYQGPIKVYRSRGILLEKKPNRSLLPEELIEEGNYSYGEKTGRWKEYSWPGILKAEGSYEGGKKNGEWRSYINPRAEAGGDPSFPETPQLYLIENYQDDLQHGKFQFFDKTGRLAMEGNYKRGKEDGLLKLYHESGQRMETYYESGLKSGSHKQYDENGQLVVLGAYYNDERSGVWYNYFPESPDKIYSKTHYKYNGNTVEIFTDNAQLRFHAEYTKEKLTSLDVYHPFTGELQETYGSISQKSEGLHFTRTTYTPKRLISSQMLWSETPREEVDMDLFSLYLDGDSPMPSFSKHGTYSENDITTGLPILTGRYLYDERRGYWKQYIRDEHVVRTIDFTRDRFVPDRFEIESSEELVKGKITFTNLDGNLEEVRLKDGIRHGKTKIFNASGELLETKKYKKGSLME